jgi:hypothetical protein
LALLDPDPDPYSNYGSGSNGPIEYGSNPDPDPKHWKIGQKFFLQHCKNKIVFNFVKIMVPKKRFDNKFFFAPVFIAIFGSEIRDPGWVKSGSGINIRDPR